MDLQLKDKVIFISGASRGIGLGIAESCLGEGAKVAITARGAEGLEATRKHLADTFGKDRIWAMAGDMTDTATIDTAVERTEAEFGPLWGAVANVGGYPSPLGIDVPDDNWAKAFGQNLESAYRLSRAALKRMTARKEGSFVFISSIAGLAAMGSSLTYSASKAAMNQMSKELARLAGASTVRVNTVAPGNIIFPGGNWEKQSTGDRAEAWAKWIKREVPLRRYGKPEEIGAAVAFLLSPVSAFTTGAVIPVDGGQTK